MIIVYFVYLSSWHRSRHNVNRTKIHTEELQASFVTWFKLHVHSSRLFSSKYWKHLYDKRINYISFEKKTYHISLRTCSCTAVCGHLELSTGQLYVDAAEGLAVVGQKLDEHEWAGRLSSPKVERETVAERYDRRVDEHLCITAVTIVQGSNRWNICRTICMLVS